MVISIDFISHLDTELCKKKDLPQENPVRPYIRLTGKYFVRQELDGHPFDWHSLLSSKNKISNY
jgi:hypothetical protein